MVNVDVIVFAQEPKLGPVKGAIAPTSPGCSACPTDAVNVKAKTGERVGHIGRAEAMACQAVALIDRSTPCIRQSQKETDMALRVYNTLTREKKEFTPVEPGKVGMYVCGPTVYKPSHIGHMVGPVIFDTVKRYLTYLGYQVTFVVNITDVDDKLIVRAREWERPSRSWRSA